MIPFMRLTLLLFCASLMTMEAADGLVLRAGDVVRIRVYDNPDMDLDPSIPASGSVSVPMIGEVVFAGRTSEEVAQDIRRRLEDGYLLRADVSCTVVVARRPVYVLGQVVKPGELEVPLSSTAISAMQAVAACGGFTEKADRSRARVIRDDPDSQGGKLTLPLPADDSSAALAQDPALMPNDTIVIPSRESVYVLGQVMKPGSVDVPAQGRLTASKAIAQSGGFDRFARKREVLLLRDGNKITLDLEAILAGKAEDPEIKPGDSLVVPANRF